MTMVHFVLPGGATFSTRAALLEMTDDMVLDLEARGDASPHFNRAQNDLWNAARYFTYECPVQGRC